MDRLLVVTVCGLLLVAAVFTLRPLLLWIDRRAVGRQAAKPIPQQWLSLVNTSVPAARHLSEKERIQLLQASRELITTRRWEGCQGLVISADMQVAIAAQACLLTLAMPGEPFPGLREILVYPRTFVPRQICDPRKWLAAGEPQRPVPELGESWGNGVIILSWDAVSAGALDPTDGHNVVLHEFAHELAWEHDLTPSNLIVREAFGGVHAWQPHVVNPGNWRRTIEHAYERLCAKVEGHLPSVLTSYAATNLGEFFAVATEVFFERAQALKQEDPELYALLRSLYRQDPADAAAA